MSSYGNEPPQNPYGQNPPPPPPPSQQPGMPGQQPGGYGYGQPSPYGAPGAPAYGAPGYGAPVPAGGYAHWGKRVGATLVDGLLTLLAGFPLVIGVIIAAATADPYTYDYDSQGNLIQSGGGEGASPISLVLILLGVLTYAAFYIWNSFIKQGKTGYSIGKGVLGIKLIKEADGQPIGAGMAFVRQICHVLDGFCYIGYLWPLWDAKKQTFADKIISTIVINQPKS